LPSVLTQDIFPEKNRVILSFDRLDDFLVASIGASSANIRIELENTFHGKMKKRRTIASCIMRLSLDRKCRDDRLLYFFHELLSIRLQERAISNEYFDSATSVLRKFEVDFALSDSSL